MCRKCPELRAENKPVIRHGPKPKQPFTTFKERSYRVKPDGEQDNRGRGRRIWKDCRMEPARIATSRLRKARIRAIRKMMGMSMKEFARLLGVSRATIFRWEVDAKPEYKSSAYRCVPLVALKCAEYEFEKWRRTNVLPKPLELPTDPSVKASVLRLSAQGKTLEEICQETNLRPDFVGYYLSLLEETQIE